MSPSHLTLDDYLVMRQESRPREVCFCAASYYDSDGSQRSVKIRVRLPKGDVGRVIKRMKRHGGIGGADETGVLRFVTWPPAVIEIRDLPE